MTRVMYIAVSSITIVRPKEGNYLRGFADIVLNEQLVIHGLKIIATERPNGLFVAFPHKKVHFSCPFCRALAVYDAVYCARCGKEISHCQPKFDRQKNERPQRDIIHPIYSPLRILIEKAVFEAYWRELSLAQESGLSSPEQ